MSASWCACGTDGGNELGRFAHLSHRWVITSALEMTTSDRKQLQRSTEAQTTLVSGPLWQPIYIQRNPIIKKKKKKKEMSTNFRFTTIFRKGTGTWWWMRACACMYAPACNQIWAKVIQGCRGPCLGALLCRDDATSDRACSTRLAAMEVAWTEPAWTQSHRYTLKHLLAVTQHCSRVAEYNQRTPAGFTEKRGRANSQRHILSL